MDYFIPFLAALVLGVLPAAIANSKGRSFGGWYVFGVFLFLPALIAAFVIDARPAAPAGASTMAGPMRRCPHCDEEVRPLAVVCKHCGRDMPAKGRQLAPAGSSPDGAGAHTGGDPRRVVFDWMARQGSQPVSIAEVQEGTGLPAAAVRSAVRDLEQDRRLLWVDKRRVRLR